MRKKDQKSNGGQDGLCNGMNEGDDHDHGKGGKHEGEYPPMDSLGGKYGGGKWGGKGGGKYGWKGKSDQWEERAENTAAEEKACGREHLEEE